MRVVMSLGLVHDAAAAEPVALHATAHDPARQTDPHGRWFRAQLDVRTLVTILTVAASIVTAYVTLKVQQADQAAVIADLRGQVVRLNRRVTEDSVSRAAYEEHNAQINLQIGALMQGQQQIYTLLFQGAPATLPRYIIRKDHP